MEEEISRAATWLHFFAGTASQDVEKIRRSLANAGVNAQPLASGTADCPGIVVFDTLSPGLCEFLRETSRNGAEQVLAVAMPECAVQATELWALLDAGAADAFLWDRVRDPASQIAARIERWHRVESLLRSRVVTKNLIGGSPVWKSILRQMVEVARFTDASVLILGDTGTGKELVARLIHTLDPRSTKRDLVVVDCTTIVPELSGSELFGHERGAFTGAVGLRDVPSSWRTADLYFSTKSGNCLRPSKSSSTGSVDSVEKSNGASRKICLIADGPLPVWLLGHCSVYLLTRNGAP
ncbi:MAG: sigma 54-interacting transcriptional regulator [Gammaproteobacteria bacterium]